MTEQEAEAWQARLERIWRLPYGLSYSRISSEMVHFDAILADKGQHDEAQLHIIIEDHKPLQCYLLARDKSGGLCNTEDGRICIPDSCPSPLQQQLFEYDWLPIIRRGCWLSGVPIDGSDLERGGWIWGTTFEELDTWKPHSWNMDAFRKQQEGEACRVASAFGVEIQKAWAAMSRMWYESDLGTATIVWECNFSFCNIRIHPQGAEVDAQDTCVVTYNYHKGEWVYWSYYEPYSEIMAQGLYRLGFEDEAVLSELPQLSNHEKLELRLSLPREFWPQKWLDEEVEQSVL
ncbi:hypothetical protein EON83_29760 [bacterium]|nr:MAG: hypothetical protein EON83_29760 [bacterium]